MTQIPGVPDHAAPEPPQPQPVLDAAKLGGLVSAAFVSIAGAVLSIVAGVTADNIGGVGITIGVAVTAAAALVTYIVSVIQGRKAAAEVTPLQSPRDARGVRLVPIDRHAA